MIARPGLRRALTVAIVAVWIANGLYAKVLGGALRHRAIVARVLGEEWAGSITVGMGLGEVGLGLWIFYGTWPRETAALQIALVLAMNVLELLRAEDLLLWGVFNFAFAILFCGGVAYHGFWLGGRRGRRAA